jgi:hypothetical protein
MFFHEKLKSEKRAQWLTGPTGRARRAVMMTLLSYVNQMSFVNHFRRELAALDHSLTRRGICDKTGETKARTARRRVAECWDGALRSQDSPRAPTSYFQRSWRISCINC